MGLYADVIFPWGMNWIMSGEPFDSQRDELLKGLSGEVLEVGFGSALNLPHYPAAVTRLVGVDPNPGMARPARRRMAQSPIDVERRVLSGESLPMEDASFETVVCSWTLCSIPDIERALAEIRRVLKPGGRFLFLEHGLSPEKNVSRWQHLLNPVQKVVGVGCHLDRNIRELVGDSGFSSLQCENYYLENTPKFVGYMYRGLAIK